MASLRAPSITAVPDSPARKNEHPPPAVPIGQWQDWQGLLLPDSDSESEAALHMWLRFEISNGAVQLVNDYHIMQSYSIRGTYDAEKCSLQFTQTFLDAEKHSHKSREFSGTITVGPHDDDPNYVTWKMEGTYVATKGRNRRSTLNHSSDNLSGSFYLEVSDLPPTQEFHRKRRTALVTMPVDRELMWEQDESRQPPPSSSSSSSSHPHHHPTFYPISLKFNEGHQITAARDPSVLIEGSYNNHDPPTFHFTQRAADLTGGFAVRTYQGRIEYDGHSKAAVAANAASGDPSFLRLKGYQTRVEKEAKVFEFIGPFVLKIAAYQPQFSSSLLLSPPNAHRVLSVVAQPSSTDAKSAATTPPYSARRIAEELDKEIANAANEEAKAKEREEQAARDKIKEEELAASLKAALELEEAEKQRKAKEDAEAEEAALAAAEEAARLKAEEAMIARREAEAKARAEAEEAEKLAQKNRAPTPASPMMSSRDQEALFKQQQAERAEAAARAEAEALAEEKRLLGEKLKLAEQRKKQLEEAKAKRKKEIDAERARMEALEENSRVQRMEERKARLAQIEASKAEIRQAMKEQDEQEAATVVADAERRAAERAQRERVENGRLERLRKKQERSLLRQSQGMSPEEIDRLETQEDIVEAQLEAAEVDSELEDSTDPHSDAIMQGLKPQQQQEEHYPYQAVVPVQQQRARDRTKQKLAAAAAAEEKSNEYIPFHARPIPDKGAFEYGKMQTKGILTQIFDLVAVEDNAASTSSAAAFASSASNVLSPPLCSAILPLTLVFSAAGVPLRYYTTDSSGHIRCSDWEATRARSLFERFERNVQLQRAAQIAAKQIPNVEGMEELAAQLLVVDGSLPMIALTLLEVGSILKNGFKSLSHLSHYGSTKEGFIIQSFVFQPHAIVYRAEFASGGAAGVGAYFSLERRTNKHSLYVPNKPPNPFNPPTLTLSNRIASYKSGSADRDSVREVLAAKVAERVGESQYNREMYAQMRRLCVGIIKRINDKTQSEDAVLVQRLCLYFKVDLGGPVHFLFGDRFDFRIDQSKAAAKQQQQQQQSSSPSARKRYLQSSSATTSSSSAQEEETENAAPAADEQK